MKKNATLTFLFFMLFILSCDIQVKNNYQSSNYQTMINKDTEYFDFKKASDSFDAGGSSKKNYILTNGAEETYYSMKHYHEYFYTPKVGWFGVSKEYYENGVIKNKSVSSRSSQKYGKEYFYNEMGKLTKEIDHDKGYHLRLEQIINLAIELNKKYGFDINIGLDAPRREDNKVSEENTQIWRMDIAKGKRWYIASHKLLEERIKGKFFDVQENRLTDIEGYYPACQYLSVIIDDTTGKIIFEEFYKERCDSGSNGHPTLIQEMYENNNKKTSAIYKSYQGKSYTQAEWKIFEQEYYNEHLRKTGRAHLIQLAETPKAEIKKSSFLADEDDIKPKKKKGFWG